MRIVGLRVTCGLANPTYMAACGLSDYALRANPTYQ